jgi:galactokinase
VSSSPEHRIQEYVRNQLSSDDRGFESLFVPGRIEILGKHTDYAGGSSIVAASSLGIQFAFRARRDQIVNIHAIDLQDQIAIDHSKEDSWPQGHWAAYPQQVVHRTFNNFPTARYGADIIISSSLPIASGMSSSSALVIGVFLCLSTINELNLDDSYRKNISSDLDLADFLSTVENGGSYRELIGSTGVGTLGGSEDHTAILASRPDKLGWFSYRPTTSIKYLPFPEDFSIVVASSGVTAQKSGNAMEDYNRASRLCTEIVTIWNKANSATHSHLGEIVSQFDFSTSTMRKALTAAGRPDLVKRFSHFYFENKEILPQFADALKDADMQKVSDLVFRSFELADELLGNQIPETRFLVQSAAKLGASGASAFGAGFGGSVYALVRSSAADQFSQEWLAQYLERFPKAPSSAKVHIDQPAGGVISNSRVF